MIKLQPGDCLLYGGCGLISTAIKIKTWSPVSHVEIFVGVDRVVAARSGGSHFYPFDPKNLKEVWRPKEDVDTLASMRWFVKEAEGQRYDIWGLFRFFTLGKQSKDKQFCSELATRFYRRGGFEPFNKLTDADLVSPGMFRTSAKMERVWPRGND